MKIIYMGTPDFAVAPLAALAENGYEVEAVITQPDKPKGRGKTMMPTPVKEEALKHGIPVLQPVKVRDPEFVEELKNLAPDIIIVAAFGQIIPKSILDMPRFGCINIHASLLPKYRGAAPIQQAVIDGEKESGVTIMQMGTGLDTGDMISRIVVPLAKDETGGSLFDKLAQAGAELLVQTLPSIFDGTATREKQPEESPTPYAAMISKKMGLLDFSKNAEELERLEEEERESVEPLQIWEGFRKRYPKIHAFECAGECEILTIKPQDIGLLPRETWTYGNNSFLLHGYYNYRYLILAKVDTTSGGTRYLLGVPGNYYSNEKYMASMFGFPHFVLAQKQPTGNGRFGYWYTDIRLDNLS